MKRSTPSKAYASACAAFHRAKKSLRSSMRAAAAKGAVRAPAADIMRTTKTVSGTMTRSSSRLKVPNIDTSTVKTRALGRILVGLSGWKYPPFRGKFYPKGLRQADELSYAAKQFPTI